jgi:AraC-like DNA-binding protein
MQILQYCPSAPLSAHVDQFWYRRDRVLQLQRQSAVPTGSVDLTINLLDEPMRVFADAADREGQAFAGAVIHGAQTRYFVIDARPDVHVMGVHFRPGGGAALLGLPAHELTDRHVTLEDVWGPYAREVRAQLLEAPTPQARFELLERILLQRLRSLPLVHPAISFALRGIRTAPTEVRIAALQQATGYGARQFTTLFTRNVGLTPKLYARIQRTRSVVDSVARGGPIDWAAVACEHGYYDQSHLTRDFREFTGVTPASYRPISPDRALHMAIDGMH